MNPIDLSSPMRQSSKGILIIFAYRLFAFVKKTFIFFIATIFTLLKRESFLSTRPMYVILGVVVLLMVFLLVAVLRFLNFRFFLKNDEFHLKKGILNKETIILGKSKIQNIYIKESFLHRLIGVVALKIESAGDKSSEIEINAIDKPLAIALKKHLLESKTHTISSTAEEDDLVVEDGIFYRVSLKKLVLEGLTQNHFKSLMVIFGFFVGLYYENKELVEEYDLETKIADWLHLDDELMANVILFNLIILVMGLMISIIVSTVKMIIKNFDLKVVERQKSFEISKGLIQTMSLTLSPERIQNIIITTNRIKRYLSLHTLSVKQAMVNEKQTTNFSIVGLDIKSLEHLTKTLATDYTEYGPEYRQRPHSFYKRVLAIRYGLIAVLFSVVSIGLLDWYALVFFGLSAIAVWMCVQKAYQKNYYFFDEAYLTKGSGLIETKTNIMALHKLQSVAIVQNIFQKRRGLASLKLTTASQKVTLPYLHKSEADILADFLIYKVESQNKDWM